VGGGSKHQLYKAAYRRTCCTVQRCLLVSWIVARRAAPAASGSPILGLQKVRAEAALCSEAVTSHIYSQWQNRMLLSTVQEARIRSYREIRALTEPWAASQGGNSTANSSQMGRRLTAHNTKLHSKLSQPYINTRQK